MWLVVILSFEFELTMKLDTLKPKWQIKEILVSWKILLSQYKNLSSIYIWF